MTTPLVIAMSQGREITLLPKMANHHGLIIGATSIRNTATLQKMAVFFKQVAFLNCQPCE